MIQKLYEDCYKYKVNLMTSILHGDRASAEDVVQEAFLRAIRFEDSYNPDLGKVSTWFNKILFNTLKDHQRSKENKDVSLSDNVSADDIISGLPPHYNDTLVRKELVGVKNKKHRRILEAFFIYGYTTTEITQIEVGVTTTNATTIINRFKEGL